MNLNQILENEQITLMQHAAATKPSEIQRHRRELGRIVRELSLFAYPHRPYVSSDPTQIGELMQKPKGRL